MRHAALTIGSCYVDSGKRLVGMAEMIVQCQRIAKPFLIPVSTLSLEHGHLVEQIVAGLLIVHLTEIVLEFLENATLRVSIALEIIALTELLDGSFLIA